MAFSKVNSYQWVAVLVTLAAGLWRLSQPPLGDAGWVPVAATIAGIVAALTARARRSIFISNVFVVAASLTVILMPEWLWVWLAVVWLLWPATYLLPVTSLLHRRAGSSEPVDRRESSAVARSPRRAQGALIAVIVALAAGSLAYRGLVVHRLEQTSLLFIGLPALLAILTIVGSRPKTPTGIICKTIGIGLLCSGIFLGEGFICIVMAAPLFFAVGIIVGWLVELGRRRLGPERDLTISCLVSLALLPFALEGVDERLSFPREVTVSVEREVGGNAGSVRDRLARTPDFNARLPLFLRAGFPRPTEVGGEGLEPGDRRVIHFAGGEGAPGDLVLEVVDSGPGHAQFRAVSDRSHIAHWLTWRGAWVAWEPSGAERTRVRWTLSYRRDLDPAVYFDPWERYAVTRAADYLIQTAAAPRVR